MPEVDEPPIKLSANDNLIDKIKPEDNKDFAHGFVSGELTIIELKELVELGISFSYQYKNGIRNTGNFLRSDFLAVDMDGNRTISAVLNDPIVQKYGSLFYTTPSHTPEQHRFRIVFRLERTITKASELTAAATALSRRLGGDLSATDAARIFYGSSGCNSQLLGKFITNGFLDELILDGQTVPMSDNIMNTSVASSPSKQQLAKDKFINKADGSSAKISDISFKTQVFCPFHNDRTASAFVAKNNVGSTFLHCSSCKITWWVEGSSHYQFNFNGFEDAILELKEGVSSNTNPKGDNLENTLDVFLGADDLDENFIPTQNIYITKSRYLNINEIKDGLTLIKSPKGTGKTTFLSQHLEKARNKFSTFEDFEDASFDQPNVSIDSGERILLIGHRQALIGDLCKRLSLNNYLEDKDVNPNELSYRKLRYGICLDSLTKVKDESYDTVVIDEVEQVLGHFLSDTIGFKRERIFECFEKLLRKAKRIIVLDADLGWTTFTTFYAILSKSDYEIYGDTSENVYQKVPIHVHINQWEKPSQKISLFSKDTQLIDHMLGNIIDGKRIFVTSNSKAKIKNLEKAVQQTAQKAGLDIPTITITSENSREENIQKFIQNIKTEILDYKAVLSSPSLGTGIDITFENNNEEIDCVYGLFETRINSHFEVDQQLARVRHPKEVNVWIAPARYNFETDIRVIADDCLRENLFNNVETDRIYKTSEMPPILIMAAQILASQRASKNSLKQNFIRYKRERNCEIHLVEEDGLSAGRGQDIYDEMKHLSKEEYIDNIFHAQTMNEYEYKIFKEKMRSQDSTNDIDELYAYIRTGLELFYRKPITKAIIRGDDHGKKRKQIRLFETLKSNPKIPDVYKPNDDNANWKNETKTRLETIRHYSVGAALMYQLLSTTPIFSEGEFDTEKIFNTGEFEQFGAQSTKLSKFVSTQLDITTKSDTQNKPIQHLWKLVDLIGLKKDKSIKPTKSNGIKTYNYKICKKSHDRMIKIINHRKQNQDSETSTSGWNFVNNLYGFEYSQEERDYLMEG